MSDQEIWELLCRGFLYMFYYGINILTIIGFWRAYHYRRVIGSVNAFRGKVIKVDGRHYHDEIVPNSDLMVIYHNVTIDGHTEAIKSNDLLLGEVKIKVRRNGTWKYLGDIREEGLAAWLVSFCFIYLMFGIAPLGLKGLCVQAAVYFILYLLVQTHRTSVYIARKKPVAGVVGFLLGNPITIEVPAAGIQFSPTTNRNRLVNILYYNGIPFCFKGNLNNTYSLKFNQTRTGRLVLCTK